MEWLRNEFAGWLWVLIGGGMLFIGALFSDLITGAADKLWKRDR